MSPTILAEGKTKIIFITPDPKVAAIYSKDDLTAGNGAKHDVIPGKGELATETTCNVFELLRRCGVPVAYEAWLGPHTFSAAYCEMIKLEVVVRGRADGSYLKRNPGITQGERLAPLVCELYLKTAGKVWQRPDGSTQSLPVDDPLLQVVRPSVLGAYDPGKPVSQQAPIFEMPVVELGVDSEDLAAICREAVGIFVKLSRAWLYCAGGTLKDLKVEFGWQSLPDGVKKLLVADVIDNDSWRLEVDGKEVSKERYRQGAPLSEVLECYRLVAEGTKKFKGLAC